MRQPRFWFTPPDQPAFRARLLTPLSAITARATASRLRKAEAYHARVPVICVGNINVGGTGKTPSVIALAEALKQAGHAPVVLTRGYGGNLSEPTIVDATKHSAAEVGDEALLLAAFAPVVKSVDRAAGARIAEDLGDVIVMDDGHQNGSVAKDITLIVANAKQGFGNARTMPAGPLREPLNVGLARADCLLTIGPTKAQTEFSTLWPNRLPRITAELRPLLTGMRWEGLRVVAFAGIGHPERFFQTLRLVGAEVVNTQALSDHQPLTPQLMKRLTAQARAQGAQLVTTEKDATRLPADFRSQVMPFPVRLDVADWRPLREVIKAKGLDLSL